MVAEDVDQGQNGQVTYSIQTSGMSGLFKIDPVTGSITTAAIMDREIFTQTKCEHTLSKSCVPFFPNVPFYQKRFLDLMKMKVSPFSVLKAGRHGN